MPSRRLAPPSLVLLCLLLLVPAAPSTAAMGGMATNASGQVAMGAFWQGRYPAQGQYGAGDAAARLTSALTPDAAFGHHGYVLEPLGPALSDVGLGDDGSVVLVGAGAEEILRLRPDGTLDPAYHGAIDLGEGSFSVLDVHVRPDGGALVFGSLTAADSSQLRAIVVGLGPDGTVDEAFGEAGVAGLTSKPEAELGLLTFGPLPDGRFVIADGTAVARFTASGQPDAAFGTGGSFPLDDPRWLAQPAGDGVFLARGLQTAGVEVQRRREDGTPDPDWGDGGTVVLPLDAHGGEGPVSYAAGKLLARSDGGVMVAVTRSEGAGASTSHSGFPLMLDAGGGFIGAGDAFDLPWIPDDVAPLPGGRFAVFYADYVNPDGPGAWSEVYLSVYDAEGGYRITGGRLDPVFTPPAVQIASGPSRAPGAVTGPGADFDFAVTTAGDLDQPDLVCAVNGGAEAPCPADGTLIGVPDGPATLRVQAIGIHGAASAPAQYEWTQNAKAPATTVTSAPPAQTTATDARVTFAADEPATFACAVDGGAAAACDGGGLELSGLAVGEHSVAIRATDALGAVEPAPVVVRWRVAAPPPVGITGPPLAGEPPVSTPKPSPEPARVAIVAVGRVRHGRIRVRIRPPGTGPVYLRVSGVIRGKSHTLGKRIVQGRAGRAKTWTIKLSKRGRRTLRRAARRSRRVEIRVFAVPVTDRAAARR
ncbi:MAG TPA: hypothetical protein VF533_21655 [Solirubrobacteraceae bacterium]|jgi:uncharacterized delta-60 repeat protein